MDAAEGRRLRRFVETRVRDRGEAGGMSWVAAELGVTRQTLYAWFNAVNEPSLSSLARLAELFGVTRAELVAILDGERPPEPYHEELRRAAADAAAQAVEEALRRRGGG